MIKTLKSYVCLTLLFSSFGAFAYTDPHPCRTATIELIDSILNTPLHKIGWEMQNIQDIKNQYPNNPRCLRNLDKISYAINNNTIRRLRRVLNKIIIDINNGRG